MPTMYAQHLKCKLYYSLDYFVILHPDVSTINYNRLIIKNVYCLGFFKIEP